MDTNSESGTTLLTVYMLDHDDDFSTIVVDLSSLDGSSSQLMYDDGTNGDVTAGDKSLSVTGTDA